MYCFGCLLGCFRKSNTTDSGVDDACREDLEKSIQSGSDSSDDEGVNYQQELWQLVLQQKILQTQGRLIPINVEGNDSSTPETFLQTLTASYNTNGFAQRVPRVREVFLGIEPFVAAINTMATSHMIAALVWGSLTLIFQCVLRFADLFDSTSQMLSDLSKALPRFRAYAEIFHTPQLHRALREVYEGFVDFCFRTIEVLQSNKCSAIMRGRWLTLGGEFERTRTWLDSASSDFEREARLADVQEQFRRHTEVMTKISSMSFSSGSALVHVDAVTNVGLPRNDRFTGRAAVLAFLHSELTPSFQEDDISLRVRCSCVIHAIGGMGKTETALEYTYSATLLESFLEVVAKLGLDEKGADPEKKVQAGLDWFQTTTSPWLLVFDNAENESTIRKFWPASSRGAIIVTTQNPRLAQNTKSQIHLQAMVPEEGSALIQSYLHRGGSEQQSAQMLSTSLGGLPLAIAHFAGYVARSQCPLDQICDSLKHRMKSSQAWKTGNVLPSSTYERTLNTVWDLAFSRLSTDSSKLLEFLAFLDPDQTPVEMFVGPKSAASTTGWQYWDTERFDAAIVVLLERHLVERYILPAGDYLRTHRALQRTILQGLDMDLPKRQRVFDEVVAIARKAFPEANIITRGDTSRYEQCARYMTQVISIHETFVQSEPAIEKRLQFAKLLSDVGYYGVNNAIQAEAFGLLETAESICTALLNFQPDEVRPVLGDILGPLQVMIQYFGVKGRHKALEISTRVITIREQQKAGIPRDEWTQLDLVNFGRAHNDMGVGLSQLNRAEEASQWFGSALDFYKSAGNEETLTSRFGHIYCFQLWPLAVAQKVTEARKLADRSLTLIAKAVGADSPLHLQTKFIVGMTLFTTGFVDEALKLHEEVFEKRLTRQGGSHHLTLGSQYNLAVCHHNAGGFEKAEMLLREILTNGCVTMQWRNEDIVRIKFRLSLVLGAQGRPEEASAIREEIASFLEDIRPVSIRSDYTDEDDMKLLDFEVSIFHGRTAGIWSNGTFW